MPDADPTTPAGLSTQLLAGSVEYADRYVYSSYYVPLPMQPAGSAPALTKAQKKNLRTYYAIAPKLVQSALIKLGHEEILKTVEVETPSIDVAAPKDVVKELDGLATVLRARARYVDHSEAAAAEDVVDLDAVADRISTHARWLDQPQNRPSTGMDTHRRDGAAVLSEAEQLELIRNLLKSEVGWLFLDRTRIRPKGWAVGEHIHTVSMGPGEELVMEQKAFTKRQATYEEQNEQERQFDLELSSTFSTELQEGLDQQTNENSTGAKGLAGLTGVDAKVNLFDIVSFEKFKATEASNETKRRSVKDSQSTTSKVASKYRSLHKITFKVTQESGFETTAKRTIRNPNKYTPIQLHYFKVLQKLELSQERFGARLCWTPCLQDPGRDVWKRLRDGRLAILDSAERDLALPEAPATPVVASKPPVTATARQSVDKWNLDASTQTNVTISVPIPPGYIWDGSLARVRLNVDTLIDATRIKTLRLLSAMPFGQSLRVTAFIEVTPRKDWLNSNEWQPVYVEAFASCIADPTAANPAYQEALQQWRTQMSSWEKQVAELKASARSAAVQAADIWEAETLAAINPMSEMMGRFINETFKPPTVRDECWEVDLWQRMFDWNSATFKTYPGWWSGPILRDASKDPGHFVNASWARLYIPINVGYEAQALRWIYRGIVTALADPAFEKLVKEVVDDLTAFRATSFGVEETTVDVNADCPEVTEKYLCLGHWYDNMPTDGTHMEVTVSGSSAADPDALVDRSDTLKIRATNLESQQADNQLKDRLGEKIDQPVQLKIVMPADTTREL